MEFSKGCQVQAKLVYDKTTTGVGDYKVTTVDYTKGNIEFKVKVKDNAGIGEVSIKPQGEDRAYQTFSKVIPDRGPTEVKKKWKLNGGNLKRFLAGGFDVEMYVIDLNNNMVEAEGHVDGCAEKWIKAMVEIVNAAVEAIKKLLDQIFDWIWAAMKAVADIILKPINDLMNTYAKKIGSLIDDCFNSPLNPVKVPDLASFIFIDMFEMLNSIFDFSKRVMSIVKPFIDLCKQEFESFIAKVMSYADSGANLIDIHVGLSAKDNPASSIPFKLIQDILEYILDTPENSTRYRELNTKTEYTAAFLIIGLIVSFLTIHAGIYTVSTVDPLGLIATIQGFICTFIASCIFLAISLYPYDFTIQFVATIISLFLTLYGIVGVICIGLPKSLITGNAVIGGLGAAALICLTARLLLTLDYYNHIQIKKESIGG